MESTALLNVSPETSRAIEVMVLKILENLKMEHMNLPDSAIEDKVSQYTGFNKTILQLIQYRNNGRKLLTKSINLDCHVMIFKCLIQFYALSKFPVPELIYDQLKSLLPDYNFDCFMAELFHLGFDYRLLNGCIVFMEDPELTFERFLYLKKIRRNRKNYYVSVREIDLNCKFNMPGLTEREMGSKSQYNGCVLFHVVNNNELVHAMFCHNASVEDFDKWIVDIVLKLAEDGSLIVLDNSPIKQKLKNKSVSMFDTKADMLKWLQQHNIPCSLFLCKAELYELARRSNINYEIGKTEQIIQAEGFDVLRLPRNFDDLSPLDSIWKNIRNECICNQETDMGRLKLEVLTLLEKEVNEISPDLELNIRLKEHYIASYDKEMETCLENFVRYGNNLYSLEEILDSGFKEINILPNIVADGEGSNMFVIQSVSSVDTQSS